MTEAEWLTGAAPELMLHFLRGRGGAGGRKLRLFAVACCRRVWHLLPDERGRAAVGVAERFAGGNATPAEVDRAARPAGQAAEEAGDALFAAGISEGWYRASRAADGNVRPMPRVVGGRPHNPSERLCPCLGFPYANIPGLAPGPEAAARGAPHRRGS